MFSVVLSANKNKSRVYQDTAHRIHRMKGERHHESLGYVEQRYLHAPQNIEPDAHYYVTCLEGEKHEPIRVNTLEDGMNLLLLLINQRGKG
jgi:hypothetical protein